MRLLLVICAAVAIAGCRPPAGQKTAAKEKPAADAKSTMQTAVDGFTGRTAIESGRKAQAKIREISADKKNDLDQVLGE